MEVIFLKLFNMSITAGWLVIAVVLLRILLIKAPKSMRCILWALVGIRLLLPFSFESMMSVIPSIETVSPDILYDESPNIHSGISTLNQAINPIISESLSPSVGESINPAFAVTFIASTIWVAGMALLILYSIISYTRLRRLVVDAVTLKENIWQSDAVISPFVIGLFRPRIYLPFKISDVNMVHVIAHEQAHVKRHDNWIKPIGFLILTVYWFNPLIWLAYILLCRDIELACDERVIKKMDVEDKKAYSSALLSCSVSHRSIVACPLAFGEGNVKQRIKNVLNYKKPTFWIIIITLLSCMIVAICFLTNPKTEEDPSKVLGEYDINPTNPTTSGEEVYAFNKCIYMNHLSSYIPFYDSGCLYHLGSNSFKIVNNDTGKVLEEFNNISMNWQDISSVEEYWSNKFYAGLIPNTDIYEAKSILELSDKYCLLKTNGTIWLMQLINNGYAWSIYELVPQINNLMTLQDILRFVQYNNELYWEHLRPYAYSDIGSGLHVYSFPIDNNWQLGISSVKGFSYGEKVPEEASIKLNYLPDNESIDIRVDDVAEFIALKESARTNDPIVFSGNSLCTMAASGTDSIIGSIVFDPSHSKKYIVPFSVYMNGEEQNGGVYNICDADSGEKLDFLQPSGMPAHTYILQNTQPDHKYKISAQYYDKVNNETKNYTFYIYVVLKQ